MTTSAYSGALGGYKGTVTITNDKPSGNKIAYAIFSCFNSNDANKLGVATLSGDTLVVNSAVAGNYAVALTILYI